MPITTNIHNDTLTRGDTFILRVTVMKTDGTPKDITGGSARFTVRSPSYDDTVVLVKTTAGGEIQLTSPAVGIIDVTVLPANTILFMPGQRYVYDLELTLGAEIGTVQKGKLGVNEDASQ